MEDIEKVGKKTKKLGLKKIRMEKTVNEDQLSTCKTMNPNSHYTQDSLKISDQSVEAKTVYPQVQHRET